jgi:hypothetical protein
MILLDDVESGETKPTSRLYQEPIAHWAAFTAAEMYSCFEAIQSALKAGQHVVCLVAYEYGQVIHRLPAILLHPPPLLQPYRSCKHGHFIRPKCWQKRKWMPGLKHSSLS